MEVALSGVFGRIWSKGLLWIDDCIPLKGIHGSDDSASIATCILRYSKEISMELFFSYCFQIFPEMLTAY